jgi:hypothetical protein
LKLLCFSLKLYFVNILVLEIKRRERESVLKKIMGERESSWFPRSLEQKKKPKFSINMFLLTKRVSLESFEFYKGLERFFLSLILYFRIYLGVF